MEYIMYCEVCCHTDGEDYSGIKLRLCVAATSQICKTSMIEREKEKPRKYIAEGKKKNIQTYCVHKHTIHMDMLHVNLLVQSI